MLHNIIFRDNIFYLTRSIENAHNGLRLDLDTDIFTGKIVNDVVFFDFGIQKIFEQIFPQSTLPDYIEVLQCLYFCDIKYIDLLTYILNSEFCISKSIIQYRAKFEDIRKEHYEILEQLRIKIDEIDVSADSYNIVSKNELSELLNF